MYKSVISTVSLFALLFSSLLSPQSFAALRCGDRMPLTLLSLHTGADAIYVGRYDKSVEGEVTEETSDYRVIPITKHYSISSALKGTTRKMLTLNETEYRFKNVQNEAEYHEPIDEDGPSEEIVPGDTVLLFVTVNEETKETELVETSDGIKKMTPDRLSAYEARIRELNGLFANGKPSHARIIDWLIKCAENPHTRWEGAFELLQSFQNMEWQDEQAKEEKEKPAEGATPEAAAAEPEEEQFETGDPEIARNVTDAHKTALTRILLNRELPKKPDPETEGNKGSSEPDTSGDRELIELVKRWGDSRVATHLIEQLRQGSDDASFNADLMASISSILKDGELSTIADSYIGIQWESDDGEVEVDQTVQVHETSSESVPANPAAENPAPEPANGAAPAENAPAEPEQPAKKKTYGDLRAELMSKFLDQAAKVLTRQENKRTAKVNR